MLRRFLDRLEFTKGLGFRLGGLLSVAILPITSTVIDAPLLRPTIKPSPDNGLRAPSQIMLDKPMTVKTDKIGPVFGHLDEVAMVGINRLLAVFLGLAG